MIRNRDAILALDGGLLIVQALEEMEDDFKTSPLQVGSVTIRSGDGDPNGRYDDPVGAIYLRTNSSAPDTSTPSLYVKQSRTQGQPTEGWVLK